MGGTSPQRPTPTALRPLRRLLHVVLLVGTNLVCVGSIINVSARIGSGCIVDDAAVVPGGLPSNRVCTGVPARTVRPRYWAQ